MPRTWFEEVFDIIHLDNTTGPKRIVFLDAHKKEYDRVTFNRQRRKNLLSDENLIHM